MKYFKSESPFESFQAIMPFIMGAFLVVSIVSLFSLAFGVERRCCDECPATPGMAPDTITADLNAIDRMCCLVFNREWRGDIWPMYDFNCDERMDVLDIIAFADVAFRGSDIETLDCDKLWQISHFLIFECGRTPYMVIG